MTESAANNVDPAEIAGFEALAHRWWDREGECRTLHEINPIRMGFIEQWLNLAGRQVLDVGCGGGILAEAMAHRGAQVTAIDPSEALLEAAKLHLLESGLQIDYRQASAESLAETHKERYEVLTCLEMLEHVPRPLSVLQACHELLQAGGHLFLSTLNRNPKSYLLAVIGAEYVLKLLPRGTHDYRRFIRPSELAGLAREAGFTLQALRGMSYNPFTRRGKLSADVDVNYLAYLTKSA